MDNKEDISPETNQLVGIFNSLKHVEIIPWQNNSDAIGFSLLKDYQDKGNFIPAKNKKGSNDSVAMIRVWYLIQDLSQKKVRLYVSISKASRYSFKFPFYDSNNPEAPTEASLAISKKSKQPVTLEEPARYELNVQNNKIYDNKKRKCVKPAEIVNEIYGEHLSASTNLLFQIKAGVRENIVELLDPINNVLKSANYYLFGKGIKKTDDYAAGVLTSYEFKNLVDLSEKHKILGSDFPISYNTAITFATIFSTLYFVNYHFGYDFLGVIKLIENISKNNFFLAVIALEALWFFDYMIPRLILFLINVLIKFKWYLISLKISV